MADADLQADMIRVSKADRQLRLMHDGLVLRSYRISLGADAQGHKRREGDQRRPKGAYIIDARNPRSVAHLSLHISCSDAADRAAAKPAIKTPAGPL
ncbi:L,D-transpeptidase family protein [Paracoccus jiaweipingae]|uniref:L,D-transpeptidase family protein n=1 Tax=unclassified Paracoccus (in: a-proteobacteria) TaxID=2688777 RepID=UPI0037AB0092